MKFNYIAYLVEDVQKAIVDNGMEIFYTTAVEGVGSAMVLSQRLEPRLQVITVLHFKHVLGGQGGGAMRTGPF